MEFNVLPEADRLFGQGTRSGGLFYHEPQKARLASFDAKSPFGANNTYTWLVSQMSPSGSRNRRRIVHSLATLDAQQLFDGGWLMSLGQEDSLHEILSVYRQLPAERFDSVPGDSQPVTIRTFSRDRQTYVYWVNDSPWETTVTIRVDLPTDCKMEKVGESRGVGPLPRIGNDLGLEGHAAAVRPGRRACLAWSHPAARSPGRHSRPGPRRIGAQNQGSWRSRAGIEQSATAGRAGKPRLRTAGGQ